MNIIEKYLEKKKRFIVDYSKKISNFLDDENITLWKNKPEFNRTLGIITENYINKYYFLDDDSYVLIGDFFDYNISNDKETNRIILLVIDYYQNTLKLNIENNKKDIYYLSIILSYAIKIETNFNYMHAGRRYKSYFTELVTSLKTIPSLRVKRNNKKEINELVNLIKKNIENEEKFIKSFELDEIFIIFKKINKLPNYYFTKYEYKVDDSKYQKDYVEKVFKREKVNDLFLMIAYELLSLTILKTNQINKDIKFIIPIPESLSNNEQDLKKINKIFSRMEIKERFKFLVKGDVAIRKPNIINNLRKNGYQIITMMLVNNEKVSNIEIINEDIYLYLDDKVNFMNENNFIKVIERKENE